MIPTRDQLEQFRLQGFFVLDRMADHPLLDRIGRDFDALRSKEDADLKAEGARRGINTEGRNFIPHVHEKSEAGADLCMDPELAELAMSILGPNVRLYWNQAVIKAPMTGGSFSWHQDAGYHAIDPQEYLTLWIPLENATVENGCIWALPGSHKWGLQEHLADAETGDKVGYQGDEDGVPVPIAKGQAIAFSSMMLHRSGPNSTERPRRAYIVQYCPTGAVDPDTGEKWGDDVEVTRDGKILADSA